MTTAEQQAQRMEALKEQYARALSAGLTEEAAKLNEEIRELNLAMGPRDISGTINITLPRPGSST